MLTKIQKWGNIQGLRLPKNLLNDVQLGVGDDVDISVKDGVIIVTPAKMVRGFLCPKPRGYYRIHL